MEKIPPSAVFHIDEESAIAFEIAFSALLTTTVLAFSSESLAYAGLRVLVIGLLAVTLARWMAVFGRYADSSLVLNLTTHYILFVTYVSFLHLFDVLADWLSQSLPLQLPSIFYLAALLIAFFILFFAIQELVFKDLLLYSTLLAYNNSQDTDLASYKKRHAKFAKRSLGLSQAEEIPASLNWLRYGTVSGEVSTYSSWIYYISMALVIMFAIALWMVATLVLSRGIATAVVLFGAIILRTPINFLYSRYGLNPFETELSAKVELASIVLGFVYALFLV